ncbi:MAG: type II toxin-antitoxin system death-on-curing family toxin, partial [Alphaproteobacteria bacterium]
MIKGQDVNLDIINESCVNYIHERMIEKYGGLSGVRDDNALYSALNRPLNRQYYDETADLFDLAAEAGYGIIRNHAFNDANKRTGSVITLTVLRTNGYDLDNQTVSNDQLIDLFQNVAANQVELNELSSFLRTHAVKLTPQKHLEDTSILKQQLLRNLSGR